MCHRLDVVRVLLVVEGCPLLPARGLILGQRQIGLEHVEETEVLRLLGSRVNP